MSDLANILCAIRDGAAARLEADGRPCDRVSLYPGSTEVWDIGTANGQLYLRVVQNFPTNNFPYQQFQPHSDGLVMPHAVRLMLGVLRPIAMITDAGLPPLPEVISANAVTEIDDAMSLAGYFYDTLSSVDGVLQKHITGLTPKPASGGVSGVEMDFYVMAMPC